MISLRGTLMVDLNDILEALQRGRADKVT